MKCPYCNHDGMIPPPKPYPPRPFGTCSNLKCRKKSRAAISGKHGEYIHYSATSPKRKDPDDLKIQRSVRVSRRREREILKQGFKSVQDFLDNG